MLEWNNHTYYFPAGTEGIHYVNVNNKNPQLAQLAENKILTTFSSLGWGVFNGKGQTEETVLFSYQTAPSDPLP